MYVLGQVFPHNMSDKKMNEILDFFHFKPLRNLFWSVFQALDMEGSYTKDFKGHK